DGARDGRGRGGHGRRPGDRHRVGGPAARSRGAGGHASPQDRRPVARIGAPGLDGRSGRGARRGRREGAGCLRGCDRPGVPGHRRRPRCRGRQRDTRQDRRQGQRGGQTHVRLADGTRRGAFARAGPARRGASGDRAFRRPGDPPRAARRSRRAAQVLNRRRRVASYSLLETIDDPRDLRKLGRERLPQLADELRRFIIDSVSRTGGHLSSNLGTVELTIALHYVFNTPRDRLVWDVGHQSYPHKILTGRRERMDSLRQLGGISGFPKRDESPYDAFGTAHSSTSISAALGMAVAARNTGENVGPGRRRHVAVIGDGAMSAGMAFEALNNAGVTPDIDLLVILNDNEMSISPAVGALNRYFARLLSGKFYSQVRDMGRAMLSAVPPVMELARKIEGHAKGFVAPGMMFEEFGFHYVGPIDGHDLDALVPTLQNLRELRGPQFLHIVTRKGQGYKLAEADPVLYHGPGKFDPAKGIEPAGRPRLTFTQVFSDWVCDMAALDERLVAITPAMREGSGLVEFERRYPGRYFDVGIAEQHAVTFAAGLACEGMKPVVAIYSTFLQ